MKSEHSRDQSMKAKPSSHENGEKLVTLDKEFAQMITDELTVKSRIKHLEMLIDRSLAHNDRASFMRYSEEYIRLTR